MKHKLIMTLVPVFMLVFTFTTPIYGADDVPRISTEQLNDIISSSDLVLLDVRTEKDWVKSDRKIVGAIRVDPDDVDSWVGDYLKEQKIILYCA